jgi:hypothetical protein
MKLISYVTGAGAKGKFSAGFDISAFEETRKETSMLAIIFFLLVLFSANTPLIQVSLCTFSEERTKAWLCIYRDHD